MSASLENDNTFYPSSYNSGTPESILK